MEPSSLNALGIIVLTIGVLFYLLVPVGVLSPMQGGTGEGVAALKAVMGLLAIFTLAAICVFCVTSQRGRK